MDIFTKALVLLLLLLLNSEQRDCSYGVACTGEVTLDQDIIPIGSNLTVRCRSNTVKCGRTFTMNFNGREILRKTSCSDVTGHVLVNEPKSMIYCSTKEPGKKPHIVCGRDIMANPIPSLPEIKEIEFVRGSHSPTIHWHSSDNMENMKPSLRFQTKKHDESLWMEGNVTQLHRGKFVLLGNLEPLKLYDFQLRVCTASMKYNCSLWSKEVTRRSPGIAPSVKLDVWRIIVRNEQSDTQTVTIMWKPLGTDDYKAVLHYYEIIYHEKGTTRILNCSSSKTQYTLELPLEVTELNVSAVTSAGNSPPAPVRLNCSGLPSPKLNSSYTTGGAINLAWDSPQFSAKASEQTMGFVVQWQCIALDVQWKRIEKNYNSVYIPAPQPTLCNISLYVEYSDGVSCPSFKQIDMNNSGTYARLKDLKKNKAIPPVRILKVHTAAENTKDGLLVWIYFITSVPVIIIVNVIYFKCTRQRIRKVCMSMGPSWLFQNLPKLGNSNAIKLLKDESYGSDLCWQPVDCDPPLSPIEDYTPPEEKRASYPIVHKEVTTEASMAVNDWRVCPYKPQIMISEGLEEVCEVAEKEEDESPWVVFSSHVFNTFEHHFFPSQGIPAALPSCLTVDGRPVSMELIDGFPFFTQTTFDGNTCTNGSLTETGNIDQNPQQNQTEIPSGLEKCLGNPFSPVQRSLKTLQLEEELL